MSFAWREKTDFIKDMPPSFSLLPTRSFYFPFPLARQDYEPKSLWRQVFDLDLPLTAILHWSPSARPVWHSEWRRKKKKKKSSSCSPVLQSLHLTRRQCRIWFHTCVTVIHLGNLWIFFLPLLSNPLFHFLLCGLKSSIFFVLHFVS